MTETAFGALLIILTGTAARHLGVIRREDGPLLVRVVINLTLPPLVFLILVRADLERSLLLVPVAGLAIHAILVALIWVSVRVWGMERPRAGALIVAGAVGNTGFFGLPLIAASGSGFSLPAAVMYDALATAIITWTSTIAISRVFGGEHSPGRRAAPLGEIGRALMLPPTWAMVAGLAVNLAGIDLPAVIERPCDLLGSATLPLTMLYAGSMIEVRGLGRLWGELTYTVIVRLGIATLLGVLVAGALGLDGDVFNTVVIMSAMPTAMMSLALGAPAGLRGDVIAGAIVVTTLLSTLTLPEWRALLL